MIDLESKIQDCWQHHFFLNLLIIICLHREVNYYYETNKRNVIYAFSRYSQMTLLYCQRLIKNKSINLFFFLYKQWKIDKQFLHFERSSQPNFEMLWRYLKSVYSAYFRSTILKGKLCCRNIAEIAKIRVGLKFQNESDGNWRVT